MRPGQQGVEVFPFASHLLVELVVALGGQDDHGPSIGLHDLSDIGRESAELPIAHQLAVADAEGPEQLGRALFDVDPGGHQRTKEVAFSRFVRADMGLGLEGRLGRRRRWWAFVSPFWGERLSNRLHDGDRMVEGRRVSGDHQLARLVHDRCRLACPVR